MKAYFAFYLTTSEAPHLYNVLVHRFLYTNMQVMSRSYPHTKKRNNPCLQDTLSSKFSRQKKFDYNLEFIVGYICKL